jgi:chemotaxis protein MotB
MKSRDPQAPTNQRERWMISYVDILSILLIFFMVAAAKSLPLPTAPGAVARPPVVVRPAASQATPQSTASEATPVTEQPVTQTVQEQPAPTQDAIPPAVQPATDAPPREEKARTNLLRAQERLKSAGLDPKLEARGLVISVPQVILFSSGDDSVNPQALPAIAQIADVLREIPNDVRLVGHADTIPVHNRRFRSNWDLSMARSEKILEILSGRYGISESRLSIASYGPWRPAASNDTADGRASNRRVEIVILDDSNPESPQAE